MTFRRYLGEFSEWMKRESACKPDAGGARVPRPHNPGAGRAFGQYLSLHAPGGLDTTADIDAERAPLLLSFTRHRRIPINWLAVLEGDSVPSSWANEATRRRIETVWLLEEDMTRTIPEVAIAPLNPDDYRTRIFHADALGDNHLFTEGNVPGDGLLVQENPRLHTVPKIYVLIPYAGKTLAAGSAWRDVREVVEVFPHGQEQEGWTQQIAKNLRTALQGSSVDWPIEPLALPVLSSRMSARAFSARLQLEWQREIIGTLLGKYLVRTAAPGAGVSGEAYWRLDEAKRQALFATDGRSFGEILIDRKKAEPKLLDPITTAGEWVIKSGKRRYLIQFRAELSAADIAAIDLTKPDQYEQAWAKHIRGLIPVAWSPSQNAAEPEWYPFGYMQTVDLSPQLITEEFSKLKAVLDVAEASEKLGDAILGQFASMTDKSPDYVRAQAEHAIDLKSKTYQPRARILTLKQRAAKLGYTLATGFAFNGLKDNEVLVPTGPGTTSKNPVDIGRLYTTEERVATYAVMQSETVTTWDVGPFNPFGGGGGGILPGLSLPGLSDVGNVLSGLGFGLVSGGLGGFSFPGLPTGGIPIPGLPGLGIGPQRHRRDYPVNVSVRYTGLREVNIDMEPWDAVRQQLQTAGFQCLMAETSDLGYVVEGGVPLREILGRCLVDEQYRQNLAVFVPVYQQSFDRGMVKVRYIVSVRPEVGSEPLGFPSIFCAEDLSYKAEWRGTELGELLHSVSLAPGEEREVTISRTVERTTEQIDSITTALDITKSDKLDLSSSIQDTLSKEQNAKNTSNWNVQASGSYGPFSAGGSGGGTNESSVRDFAETIKKSAMQSTREMRVNQKQEIKSSTTTETSVKSSESTKSTFSNINQGRTLNIQFHEVNNIYRAGLVVENLRLTYIPSVELIQGLGIHDVLTFNLRDLGGLLACANNDVALTGGDFLYDLPSLERRILRTVVRTILHEYVSADKLPEPQGETEGHEDTVFAQIFSAAILEGSRSFGLPPEALKPLEKICAILNDSLKNTDTARGPDQYVSTTQECQRYVDVLTKLYQNGQVLEPHTLTVPSSATYADAQVGLSPSTEPYSERMREAEIGMKYADIENRYAESEARRSLAGLPPSDRRSMLKATLERQPGGKLSVEAYPPFEKGSWTVLCDGETMAKLYLARSSATLEIAPTTDEDWPRTGGHQWVLVGPDRHDRIVLPVY